MNSMNYKISMVLGKISDKIEKIGLWFFSRAIENYVKSKKDSQHE